MIPGLISRIQNAIDENHQEIQVWGHPDVTRSFLHATDVATAFVRAVEFVGAGGVIGDDPSGSVSYTDPITEVINVGSSEQVAMRELVGLLAELMGFSGRVIFTGQDKIVGDRRRSAKINRLRSLGWRPSVSLHDGLKETIEWYRRHVWKGR